MRENCNEEELQAHHNLDIVKAGATVSQAAINRALFVLGDGVGIVQLGETTMQPHQKRVIDEKSALDTKIEALTHFIGSPIYHTLSHIDQYLLRRQLVAMNEYSSILKERIDLFGMVDV